MKRERRETSVCEIILEGYKGPVTYSDRKARKTIENMDRVVEYLRNNGNKNANELSEFLKLGIARTRRLLAQMIYEGLITVGGYKRDRMYGVITTSEEEYNEFLIQYRKEKEEAKKNVLSLSELIETDERYSYNGLRGTENLEERIAREKMLMDMLNGKIKLNR